MSTITIDNLIPLQQAPKPGQRVLQIAPNVWLPVGLQLQLSNSSAAVELQTGVLVNDNGVLKVQPLSFNGTQAYFSDSLQQGQLKIFNTSMGEPAYGGSSGTPMEFYKCTAIQSSDSIAYYTVSGAGTQRCNGAYYKFGTWYSYPSYYHVDSNSQILYMYHLSGGYWVIYPTFQSGFVNTTDAIYYRISSDNTGSWQKGTGSNPAPTVAGVYGSNTWSGRKAVLKGGIYSFQSNSTEGLTYNISSMPVVGSIYNRDASIKCSYLPTSNITTQGLIFYDPLQEINSHARTGQEFNFLGYTVKPITPAVINGIPCLYFQGGSCIQVPIDFNFSSSFTISMWIKALYPSQVNRGFFSTSSSVTSGGGQITLQVWQGDFLIGYGGTDYNIATSTADTSWVHLLLTTDNTTNISTGYINGVSSGSLNAVAAAQRGTFQLAGRVTTENGQLVIKESLIGYMAALRIYNRVLSSTQITALSQEFTPTA